MKDSRTLINGDGESQNGVDPQTVEVTVCMPDRGNLKRAFTFDVHDKVWAAKQIVINEMCKGLRDVLNYGFYDPPYNGRSGKFLEEERPLRDYPLRGPHIEFKYKRRVYRSFTFDEKALQKIHTKGNLRRLMDCVASNSVNQVFKLTEKGLDPNFQDDRTGETPLTAAAKDDKSTDLIITLVNGGAHLDFRAKDSQTALHKAAAAGKVFSVKTLLDLGASPNYKDAKGLTPLYYCVLQSANPYCCEILLNDHSELQIVDHQGMQEIHHACKNGLVQHLEHLLFYGANIDARTASGNTGLHITALSNHEECARVLLFRGARRDILNYANQSAYEVAAVAGNKSLAELIKYFDDESIVKVTTKPSYSTRRRKSVSKPSASSVFNQTSSEQQLSAKSTESLSASTNSSLNSLQSISSDPVTNGENGTIPGVKLSRALSMTSSASDSSYCSEDDSSELSPPMNRSSHATQPSRHESISSIASIERGAPPVKSVVGAATIRKRVYASSPGKKFKAVNDYCTEMPGELTLQKGDVVEVLYVGERGFWEGRVGDRTGWFPHKFVQEYKEKEKHRPKTLFGRPPTFSSVFAKSDPQINVLSDERAETPKIVKLQKTKAGFGFQMRGANSHVPRLNFKPTPEFPALQYFGEVEKGGEAYTKGIRCGDFILEVNGENVTTATHNHVVELIKKSGKTVLLKVISAPQSPVVNGTVSNVGGRLAPDKYGSLSRLSTKSPPTPPSRHPSTTLTLGRMKSTSRPSLYELGIQHSYEDPSSFRVDSVITVSKENRFHTLQKQKPSTGRKTSVKKEPVIRQRSTSTSGHSGSSKGYQRSVSMQNIRQAPPSYESVISTSKAVPFPTVPVGATIPLANSEGAKSTPDILSASSELEITTHHLGPETLPKPVKERPMSYGAPEFYRLNQLSEEKSEISTDVTISNSIPTVSRSISQPVVNISPVDQSSLTRTNLSLRNEKENRITKNVSLSDALQMAIAERNTRKNKRIDNQQKEEAKTERNLSAPTQINSIDFQSTDMRQTLDSKQSANKELISVETSKSSERFQIEKIQENEECPVQNRKLSEPCSLPEGVESVHSKIEKLEKHQVSDESMATVSSESIYRQYTSPTTKKQFLFDMPSSAPPLDEKHRRHSSSNGTEKKLHLGSRSPPKVFIPPPPPPIMPQEKVPSMLVLPRPQIKKIEANLNVPMTAVRSGLVDVGSLRTQKGLLKSVTHEGPKRNSKRHKKGPKSPLKESATLSMQHSNLLAKAVAARAARMAAEEREEETGHKSDDEFAEPSPGKKDIIPSSQLETKFPTKVEKVQPRKAKVPPPVMPKKKIVSPRKGGQKDEEGSRLDNNESQNLPFNIPAPVLSEEDKTLVLLDEILRHEAESENWSLNSWNSSDSSTDVIVPPPLFSISNFTEEQNVAAENSEQNNKTALPWYEQRSESEENLCAETSNSSNGPPSPMVNAKQVHPSSTDTQSSASAVEKSAEVGKTIARQIPIKVGNKQISISVITHSPLPDTSPTQSPLPDQSPTHSPLPDKSPTQSLLPDKSPTHSPLPDKSPTHSPLPGKSPTHSPLPDESPTHSPLPNESPNTSPPSVQRKPSLDRPDNYKSQSVSVDDVQVLIATPISSDDEAKKVSVSEVTPASVTELSSIGTSHETPIATTEVTSFSSLETAPVSIVTTTEDLPTAPEERPSYEDTGVICADQVVTEDSLDDVFELPPPPVVFDDLDGIDGEVPDSPPLPPPPEFCLFTEDGASVDNGSIQVTDPFAPPPAFSLEQENEVDNPSPTDDPAPPSGSEEQCSSNSIQDKPMLSWSCENVCDWLDSIGMSQYRKTFEENDIRGIHLPELTKAELRELGVKSLGHRMTIENSIAQLCHPMESSC